MWNYGTPINLLINSRNKPTNISVPSGFHLEAMLLGTIKTNLKWKFLPAFLNLPLTTSFLLTKIKKGRKILYSGLKFMRKKRRKSKI